MRISDSQIQLVNGRIDALIAADNFYGKKLKAAGITSVSTPEEFEALPFSEKSDLRDAYPLGLMTAPEEEIVRIHSSSGTIPLSRFQMIHSSTLMPTRRLRFCSNSRRIFPVSTICASKASTRRR